MVRLVPLMILVCLVSGPWGCNRKDPAAVQRRVAQVKAQTQGRIVQARNKGSRELFEQTEGLLEQAIKDAPQDDELYVLLGHVLKEKHFTMSHTMASQGGTPGISDPPARIRVLLEKAIAINPDNKQAYWIMANYLRATTKPGDAIKYYRKMKELDPGNLSINLEIGVTYLAMEQLDTARAELQKVLKSARTSKDGHLEQQILDNLARVAMKQGKHDEAEKYFLEAMETGGGPANCSYHALGELYAGLGKFKKGAKFVIKAAELEPQRVDIQFRAAVFSFLAYDFKGSRKYCDRIITRSPDKLTRTYNVSGFLLLLEKKYDQAEKAFNKVLEVDPQDPGAKVGMGHLALIKKDYQGVRSLLESHAARPVTSTQPQSYPYLIFKMASLGMAWLLSNQGKHRQAIKYFDQILSVTKTDLFALLGKGSSLIPLGRLDEARAAFKKVLELDPGNQYGLAELGLVRLNSGDIEGAKEAFSEAKASGGQKYTCPYEGLGLVYLRQGKIAQAKQNFEKAIAINPNIEFKKYNELAKILLKQGKTDKAISLLNKSIQNYPYDPEAKNLLQKLQGALLPGSSGAR